MFFGKMKSSNHNFVMAKAKAAGNVVKKGGSAPAPKTGSSPSRMRHEDKMSQPPKAGTMTGAGKAFVNSGISIKPVTGSRKSAGKTTGGKTY